MNITIADLAESRGVKANPDGGIPASEFFRVGLDIMGGCHVCGATIAAYNACPTKVGYWACSSGCVGDNGFESVEEFEAYQDWPRLPL